MKRVTRGMIKRKMDSQDQDDGNFKRASFSNLTNFKSPKKSQMKRATSLITIPKESTEMSQSRQVSVSQVSTQKFSVEAGNTEIVKMMQTIKKVLENDFKDVCGRLQLQSIPTYLYDIKSYHKEYKKTQNLQLASAETKYVAKNFYDEDRHVLFINLVRGSMCAQKKFPGPSVIRHILEMILKIAGDDSSNPCMSVQQTIIELYNLFTCIYNIFPTSLFRDDYLKMFQMKFNVGWIKNGSKDLGIFEAMLELVGDLIHNVSSNTTKKIDKDSDKLNNFFYWDVQNDLKFSFENFSRDKKFDRVFMVLDLMIQVMESDLAMFIIRHSSKLRTSITEQSIGPLVCLIIWKGHESTVLITAMIKNIVSLFVTMVGLNYPKDKISILSRLLSLVSQVLNIQEYPDQTFESYPSYSDRTKDLVNEIQKTVENSQYFSMELITDVAEQLRSPLLRMLFVNQMLGKINNETKPISLDVPYNLIKNRDFENFNSEGKVKVDIGDKFPLHNLNLVVKRCQVTQYGYLKLLEMYADSVNTFYCIQTGFKELTKKNPEDAKIVAENIPDSFDFLKFEEIVKEVDLDEPVLLRRVDVSYKKLVHIRLSKESCSFYRNEMKHFILFIKLIKTCHDKYGSKFDDLMKLAQKMEA